MCTYNTNIETDVSFKIALFDARSFVNTPLSYLLKDGQYETTLYQTHRERVKE